MHTHSCVRVLAVLIILGAALFSSRLTAGTYTITTTADDGAGSLRDAITSANTILGRDTILFNLTGNVVHTIRPLTPFPIVTDSLVINGYSQPGSSVNTLAVGNNARILIQLDGSLMAGVGSGITIQGGGNSIVRGLVVNRFSSAGIALMSANNIAE